MDLQVNGTRLQLNRLPAATAGMIHGNDVHHSLSDSFVSELEELNPSSSASQPPQEQQEQEQQEAHGGSFRHRPIPVQIQYPPVRTSPSSSPSRGWYPTSAGQFDHGDSIVPHPFLHAQTGRLAYTKPNEVTQSAHVSPPRLRPSRSRSRSHSRSAAASRSSSPPAHMQKRKHEFLRAHTGGHAHPDLPMHYASLNAEEEEESKQEVESSSILELMDDPQALSQQQQPPQPIQMQDLKPVSPTRYPFHHVAVPTPGVATHAASKPATSQISSSKPATTALPAPGAAPGTLTAYIQRFRNQPPRPSASRQALPPMWWMHPSNQVPPPTAGLIQHSIPALNLPAASTADQLRAMEMHIEQQKSERQRRKDEQARQLQQQQQEQIQHRPQIDEAKKQQHQHNIVQLAKELNAGTSLSQESIGDESKEDMGYSLSAESFSALDALDHNALVPSPRLDEGEAEPMPNSQVQNASVINTSMMASQYNPTSEAAPRQPKNSILDDSDDFSALLPSATGAGVEHDLPLPVPRSSLQSRGHHLVAFVRPHVEISNVLASTQDVDDLLSKWRAAHRQNSQPPHQLLRPHVQSSRSHRFDHTPSPPRGRASAREPENSPEVDKLISRLKRRLGLNESDPYDASEKENEEVAASIQHLEESRQKLRETLSARQSSRREYPSGTPFVNPVSTRPSYIMPLEKVLQQPKVAEKDYIDSARRVAQEDSKNTPPSSTTANKSESHHLPSVAASTQTIIPPLKLPMHEVATSPQRSALRTADSDVGYSVLSSARSFLDSDRKSLENSARLPGQLQAAQTEFSLQPVDQLQESKTEQQRKEPRCGARRSKKKDSHRDRFLPPKISIHINPAALHPVAGIPPVHFTANMEPITTAHPAEPRAIPLPVVEALPVSQDPAHEVLASPVRSHPSSVAGSPLAQRPHSEHQQQYADLPQSPSYPIETMQETYSPPHKPRIGVRRSVLGEDEVEEEKKEEPRAQVEMPVELNRATSIDNGVIEAEAAPIVSAVPAAVAAPAIPSVSAPVPVVPSQPLDISALQQQMMNAQFAFAMAMQQQAAQMVWNPMFAGMMHGLPPFSAAPAQAYPFYPPQPAQHAPVPAAFPAASQPLPPPSTASFSPPPSELNRLCAELGMTVEEYYADPPLQLLVQQLARLQAQELQAQHISASIHAQPHHPAMMSVPK